MLLAAACAWPETTVIRGARVHPVASPAIENGTVVVMDGRIASVGGDSAGPADARVVDGKGLDLYPGLINAATNVGLSEISAVRETEDTDEIGPFNPELRAQVAVNPTSEHIAVTRAAGITSVLTLPGQERDGRVNKETPIITGQGAVMHLDGWTWEEMAVKNGAVMEMFFPLIRGQGSGGFAPAMPGAAPRTIADDEKRYRETLASISDLLQKARWYGTEKTAARPSFHPDLRLDALLDVVNGKQPMMIRAEKERSIKDAVALADREHIHIVIANPTEMGSTGSLLKTRSIPVVLGKTLALPLRDDDPYDAPFMLPGEFFRAGVKICFGTFDTQFARNVAFEAAQAAAFGLPPEEALKAVTLNSAEILGVGDRLGSIEKGKVADLILTDGDPLEARTSIKRMWIAGQEVSLESRHTREYETWSKRPKPEENRVKK